MLCMAIKIMQMLTTILSYLKQQKIQLVKEFKGFKFHKIPILIKYAANI